MGYRCVVGLTFGLAVFGLWFSGSNTASGKDGLVPCYDAERELVQKVAPANCEGMVVSPSKAERIRDRIKQERLKRARDPKPRPRRPSSEKSGSGVLVTDAGHIVTAAHVITGCRRTQLHHPSSPSRDARIVARHPNADLALLHAPSVDRAPIAIALGKGIEPGDRMATIGYPNLGRTVIQPIRKPARFAAWKAIGQKVTPGEPKIVFQGDLRPGNSGGALVDQHERLVGLVIAEIDTPGMYATTGRVIRHIGFAEPISSLRELLASAGTQLPVSRSDQAESEAEGSVFRITCQTDGTDKR